MATPIRNVDPIVGFLVDAVNGLKAQIGAGSSFHLDASEVTVTAANATDLASALVMVNQLRAVQVFHRADTLAHKIVDVATIAAPVATDLATAITLANELKADYATHRAATTLHYNADSTNTVSASDATDLSSLVTLVNELKVDFNAHMASAPSAASLRKLSF